MSFDPPPDPPPGANVPPRDPQDPRLRQRGRLTDPSDAPPETGIRRRTAIRHNRIVLVFLWLVVILFALGLYFILTAEEGEPLLKGSIAFHVPPLA